MTVSVAVVGAGFMGTNHARVLSALPGATLAAIVDRDQSRGRLAGVGAQSRRHIGHPVMHRHHPARVHQASVDAKTPVKL